MISLVDAHVIDRSGRVVFGGGLGLRALTVDFADGGRDTAWGIDLIRATLEVDVVRVKAGQARVGVGLVAVFAEGLEHGRLRKSPTVDRLPEEIGWKEGFTVTASAGVVTSVRW